MILHNTRNITDHTNECSLLHNITVYLIISIICNFHANNNYLRFWAFISLSPLWTRQETAIIFLKDGNLCFLLHDLEADATNLPPGVKPGLCSWIILWCQIIAHGLFCGSGRDNFLCIFLRNRGWSRSHRVYSISKAQFGINCPAASNGVSKAFSVEWAIRSKLRGINPKGLKLFTNVIIPLCIRKTFKRIYHRCRGAEVAEKKAYYLSGDGDK